MSGLGEQGCPINTPLNFGIAIFAPLSSVPGSPSFGYFQPLLTGNVLASAGILIGAELFLFLAQHFFGLEGVPVVCPGTNANSPIIKIPVPELQELLSSLSKISSNPNDIMLKNQQLSQTSFRNLPNQTIGSFIMETPEIPLTITLTVSGYYSNEPYCPTVSLFIPIITIPGIRGALPILILGILETIFVRAVVPPESTGAKPLKKSKNQEGKPFSFSSEELLNLLNRFGKHFSSQ